MGISVKRKLATKPATGGEAVAKLAADAPGGEAPSCTECARRKRFIRVGVPWLMRFAPASSSKGGGTEVEGNGRSVCDHEHGIAGDGDGRHEKTYRFILETVIRGA